MRGRFGAESVGYALAVLVAAAAPTIGRYAGVSFAAIALGHVVSRSAVTPASYGRRGRRSTVFAATAAVIALLIHQFALPVFWLTGPVVLVVAGTLGARLRWREGPGATVVFMLTGGAGAALAGTVLAPGAVAPAVLGATTGAIVAGTARSVLASERPAVLLVAGTLGLGVATTIGPVTGPAVATALVITAGLGAFAYTAGSMTASGTFAGVLLAFVTIVAAGYGWFLLLGLFVVSGAVCTHYREDEKEAMGIVEFGEHRRSFANVMANGAVALTAALAAGAAAGAAPLAASLAFGGSIATASGDTLSSEIGSVHGEPRLITTLERVRPGTDGGVSPVGEVVTVVGAATIAMAAVVLGVVPMSGAIAVTLGGVAGAHADSLLGATVEDRYVGNDAVNLLACVAGGAVAIGVGTIPIV